MGQGLWFAFLQRQISRSNRPAIQTRSRQQIRQIPPIRQNHGRKIQEDLNEIRGQCQTTNGTCLTGAEESAWERVFKHLVEKGFSRPIWNFDSMLSQAQKKLKPTDYKYAKALAAAFLDESQVPALEKFPRWKKLQPLDPALVNPDGTISDPKKA